MPQNATLPVLIVRSRCFMLTIVLSRKPEGRCWSCGARCCTSATPEWHTSAHCREGGNNSQCRSAGRWNNGQCARPPNASLRLRYCQPRTFELFKSLGVVNSVQSKAIHVPLMRMYDPESTFAMDEYMAPTPSTPYVRIAVFWLPIDPNGASF